MPRKTHLKDNKKFGRNTNSLKYGFNFQSERRYTPPKDLKSNTISEDTIIYYPYARRIQNHNKAKSNKYNVQYKTATLYNAKFNGQTLTINVGDNHYKHKRIWVFSKNNRIYRYGKCNLEIGDEVLVSKKEYDHMTFAHYRITAICDKGNCNLIYSKCIYHVQDIDHLPRKMYVDFLKGFAKSLKLI